MAKVKNRLSLIGKYDVRPLLGSGPLKELSIDEVMDDINVTAAIIDTYTLIIQNCEYVNLFDCINDTLNVPEVNIRYCKLVKFPSVIRAVVTQFTNSTIMVEEGKKLHIGGDLILTESTFVGEGTVVVNGTIYADGDSYKQLDDWNIEYSKAIDVGDINKIHKEVDNYKVA